MNPAQHLLRGAIRCYQLTLRPIIGCNCRFHPHCSDYGREAVAVHGAVKGAGLTAWRILRCNPWHPGGYDPVPPPAPAGAMTTNAPAGAMTSNAPDRATKGSFLP